MERRSDISALRVSVLEPSELEGFLPLIESYQRLHSIDGIRRGRNRGFFGRLISPSEHGALLGAWRQEQPVGYACIHWELDSTRAREVVSLRDLYVIEAARSGGVGRSLVAAAADMARTRGARALVCRVDPEDVGARGLLDAAGAEATAAVSYELRL